jgi:hypothetical protein
VIDQKDKDRKKERDENDYQGLTLQLVSARPADLRHLGSDFADKIGNFLKHGIVSV